MIIVNKKKEVVEVTCDGCELVEEINGDFDDALAFIRDQYWYTNKLSQQDRHGRDISEWSHYCTECRELEAI